MAWPLFSRGTQTNGGGKQVSRPWPFRDSDAQETFLGDGEGREGLPEEEA